METFNKLLDAISNNWISFVPNGTEDVLKYLEKAWREINKQFPEDYEEDELNDDIADIENERDNLYNYEDYDMTIEDVEENINYLLSNFYDYCDNMGIWVEM